MGLDTSHDAWHGPYGNFSAWRNEIAKAAGLISYGENLYRNDSIDWQTLHEMSEADGFWITEPDDPIWYLIQHSDCDGIIQYKHLLPLANRLEEIYAGNTDTLLESFGGRNRTQQFIDGLLRAYLEREDLDFH